MLFLNAYLAPARAWGLSLPVITPLLDDFDCGSILDLLEAASELAGLGAALTARASGEASSGLEGCREALLLLLRALIDSCEASLGFSSDCGE